MVRGVYYRSERDDDEHRERNALPRLIGFNLDQLAQVSTPRFPG